MYPNPQEALPLAPRPNLEQYREARERPGESLPFAGPGRRLCVGWRMDAEARHAVPGEQDLQNRRRDSAHRRSRGRVRPRAVRARRDHDMLADDAQFVIARAVGFLSWPKLATHLESAQRAGSPVSAYEQAVDAIVSG